eukprot:TRINITY_DN656_c0_g1_i5.p1 TRINITY_DN656_c0_g1~~TRINITY_DN656_c0_g1_i5.p1  ORF type:complete len:110 (+),score=27.24 TRINITY_DN656_c0_g1_i5:216-545(+)
MEIEEIVAEFTQVSQEVDRLGRIILSEIEEPHESESKISETIQQFWASLEKLEKIIKISSLSHAQCVQEIPKDEQDGNPPFRDVLQRMNEQVVKSRLVMERLTDRFPQL